jgi:hypothetical protein
VDVALHGPAGTTTITNVHAEARVLDDNPQQLVQLKRLDDGRVIGGFE